MADKRYKSVTELFNLSASVVRKNLGIFVFVNIVTILTAAWQVGTMLKDSASGVGYGDIFRNGVFGSQYPKAGSSLLFLLLLLVSIVLWLMKTILVVRAANGKKLDAASIWEELKVKWLRLIGVTIVSGLFILVGFILFIIPGILILPRLIMAPYLLVDQNVGIREAINRSWDLGAGKFSEIYAVILFSFVLGLPALFPIVGPIISTALAILYSVAMPLRYFELKKKS